MKITNSNMHIYFVVTSIICLLLGCKSHSVNEEVSPDIKSKDTTAGLFTIGEGWDIYTGGVYRYGPSIMIHENNSIDVWFAAPGGTFGEKILNYVDQGSQSALALGDGDEAGQIFNSDEAFYGIAIACPNWASLNSSITMSIYKWKNDYVTTLSDNPIMKEVFSNYLDNQNIMLKNENKFEAGTYLWVLSNPSGTAGVWKKEGNVINVENYLNGVITEGSYQAYVLKEKSSQASFWDQVSYQNTIDGGKNWSAEEMVLTPSEGSRDQFSVCDPAAIKIGEYYYIGYTSTEDEGGIFNHVYVARSTIPRGPWLKWDGTGWSQSPEPVITFTGNATSWGAGEPSMVVNNDSLFFYYTWNDETTLETRVATADANDQNWPAHLTFKGTAMDKSAISGADHSDVKFREDLNCYQAISTASRLTADSYIILWESPDGIKFHIKAEYKTNLKPYLHNCGWSGDEKGHIQTSRQQYISYAYGPNWANWNTAWHPISFQ